jgi:hypothetical protein
MESSGGYLRGLVILSVLFALSLGVAVATNAPVIAKIIGVNYLGVDQWVEIANEETGSIDLTGWTLMNTENQTYSFPANFTLKAGSLVRVHSGKGNNAAADLFNSTLVWNKNGDTATLKDATGKIASGYNYPIEVSSPVSVTKINPLVLANTVSIGGTSHLESNPPVQLSGHSFICHGGPLNWAWTSGLR